jgi:glycosyltransferase involved in cell wall biosynthesis
MKLLISAFQCAPGYGSEPGNGWYWPTALASLGHDVTVVTDSAWRSHVATESANWPQIRFEFVDLPQTPVRYPAVLQTADRYRRWQVAAYRHMAATGLKFDVIHHTGWGSIHLGSQLWRLPAPLVFGPVGGGQTAPAGYWRYFGRDWPLEAVRNVATNSLLGLNPLSTQTVRNAAVTLATNRDTVSTCKGLGARDVRYSLAEGLPADWIASPRRKPAGVPTVLWVGRMLPRKAPTLAVRGFAELRRMIPARLVMAGDGPLLEQVRELVGQLGIADSVDLPGRVQWSDLVGMYDEASAFLFCSLRDSSGSQFLEALGRGLPAVALAMHGVGDTETGIAAIKVPVEPRPEEMPAQIGKALHTMVTGDDWEDRSAAGVHWAAGNTWAAKAEAATRIYEELTKR